MVACTHGQCLVHMRRGARRATDPFRSFNTQAGGFVVWGRVNANLNISRALGDASFKQVGDRVDGPQVGDGADGLQAGSGQQGRRIEPDDRCWGGAVTAKQQRGNGLRRARFMTAKWWWGAWMVTRLVTRRLPYFVVWHAGCYLLSGV